MAHLLAACSRVLYDKQILDDRKHIETINKEKDRIQEQLRRLKMKYKYLELNHRMLSMEDFLRDLWENAENREEKAFHILCDLCDCEYEYANDNNSLKAVSRYPYVGCCESEYHLVLTYDVMNCPEVHFGRKFWNATNIKEQIPVYLLFYTIEKVYMYTNGWYDEAIFFWVVEKFLMPYKTKVSSLPHDVESFEEYFRESETFSLEDLF